MASLNSWLYPDVMRSLGWALIHSLWQCAGIAGLAAVLMAYSRRPAVRYLFAVGALVAMLAAPVATMLLLMKSNAPVHAFIPANSGSFVFVPPAVANDYPITAPSNVMSHSLVSAFASSSQLIAWPNFISWLVVVWLSGVVLFSLRFTGGFLLLEYKRRKQAFVPSHRIVAMCKEVQRQLGLCRTIRYLECSWLQAPAVTGWFRPIVLLPIFTLTGLSEEQLRGVIAHELAHIRRLDCFVNLFQIAAETLLFYHPAMWWLNRRICAERELCCDDIAVSLSGNRIAYAKALALMAKWESAPSLAMAANRGPLSERIFHIVGQKSFGAGQRIMGLTGSVVFLAGALGAANALLGIAYPIPNAHASMSPQLVLPSNQIGIQAVEQPSHQTDAIVKLHVDPTLEQHNHSHLPSALHALTEAVPTVRPEYLALSSSITLPQPVPNDLPALVTKLAVRAIAVAQNDSSTIVAASDDKPSGIHDPDALSCDAPQLVPLTKAVGWRVCAQNSIVAVFSETGALSPSGAVIRSYSDLPMSQDPFPTGAGDPNAVICTVPTRSAGSLQLGRIACAHNDFWAKLDAAGCTLSPDLRHIVRSGTTKKLNPIACTHIMGHNGIMPPVFF